MADLNKAYSIINDALDDLKRRLGIVEPRLNALIFDWVKKFETYNGNILKSKRNDDRLLAFKRAVDRFLLESGYNSTVGKFLVNFDELQANQQTVQSSLNNLTLTKSFLNPYKTWAVNNTVAGMQAAGLNLNFVTPLQNELFTSINQGGSLKDLITKLEKMTVSTAEGTGLMLRNAIQVSRDALGGYNGVVNEAIRKVYKMDGVLYVGSLIKDSRAQCERWVNYETFGKRGLIPFNDLDAEIQWALNNGTGMIRTTTPETFCQDRGGYACRHDAYPVRLENYKKESK